MEIINAKIVDILKANLLIIIGIALMIEGFSSFFYSSYVLFPPTEPPLMKSVEGMDIILITYRQALLYSGFAGIIVSVIGILLYLKQKNRIK